jgi:hypothetical protein
VLRLCGNMSSWMIDAPCEGVAAQWGLGPSSGGSVKRSRQAPRRENRSQSMFYSRKLLRLGSQGAGR